MLDDIRIMPRRKVTQKEKVTLQRYDRFCQEQGGVYPSTIAAIKLGLTPAGVYQAAQRGWIAYVLNGRDRLYSRKDVHRYADAIASGNWRSAMRAPEPKDCTHDDDGGKARGVKFTE
jgi:hypothetical protein